ncbi:MAG: copper-binding protein [Rhodospirillales bacterium]|nr:copper-binding protein [Rhodospirillales bacterium]MDE0712067.1 copper-binding protein [Rhodospirillales bacterium]
MTRLLTTLSVLAFVAATASSLQPARAQEGSSQDRAVGSETLYLLAENHEAGHADHGSGAADSRIAHGTGVIHAIDSESRSLTIDHEPIDEIGMGAMTMGFGVVGAVDLSGLSEGDPVAFQLKRGRDNSYRVTAICNRDTHGPDCLAGSSDE